MKSISFYRVLKFGFLNFWRNIWLSTATIMIMTLAIFSIASLTFVNIISEQAIISIEDKIDISIYFADSANSLQIENIQNQLSSLPETKEVSLISPEEAIKKFQSKHQDNELLMSSVRELDTNPLTATLIVKAKNPDDYKKISSLLAEDTYAESIRKISYDDNKFIIEKLTATTETIQKVGLGISIVFSIISILVIFNTIRISIYSEREEIVIMKLVGSTNMFIRLPYLLEGILYGIFSSILSTAILYPILKYSSPKINSFFQNQGFDVFTYFTEHLVSIYLIQLLLGIALGIISSSIAIRRYLKQETLTN